jgi:D-alanyl-D-alanine carboxypeptidase
MAILRGLLCNSSHGASSNLVNILVKLHVRPATFLLDSVESAHVELNGSPWRRVEMPRFTSQLRWLSALSAALLLLLPPSPASAQVGSDRYASVVMDSGTGGILSAASADEPRYPASLTKMMTLYMLFEALRDRRVSLDQQVPVSAWAASMPRTKLDLVPGNAITVEQAILGLVTKSANDAAAALGEMLGGDEERFAQMMTLRARALGMTRTTFRNASGLPDLDQVTTARDMAVLARHLVQDHPAYYRYFSVPFFVFRGRMIPNHQNMLQTYPGADGLKTGWIRDSGHNLVTSAVRGDTRLIGVVLGAASSGERDQDMAALLDAGFDRTGAPVVLARRDPAPGFRMPSVITSAQAAPAYQPPLYSAPYSDALGSRYQAGYGTPFLAAPPLLRAYGTQAAYAQGVPQPMRLRATEPAWREPPTRAAAREPAMRRIVEGAGSRDRPDFRDRPDSRDRVDSRDRFDARSRYDARDRADPRAERFRVRPIMAAPPTPPAPPRAQPVPTRGHDAPRVIRPAPMRRS